MNLEFAKSRTEALFSDLLQRLNLPRQAVIYAGYAVFFGISFVLFLYLTFPYDVLKQQLTNKANNVLLRQNKMLSVEELGASLPLGLSFSDVRLFDAQANRMLARIERGSVHLPIHGLPLLFIGRLKIAYAISVHGGRISGSLTLRPNGAYARAKARNLSMAGLVSIAGDYGVKLKGELRGDLALDLPEWNVARGDGTLNLSIQRGGIEASQILGFLPLPAVPFKEAKAYLRLEKKTIEIHEGDVQISGPDLSASLTGSIGFDERNAIYSQIRCRGYAKPSAKLESQILEGLRKDFDFMVPVILANRDPQGAYGFQILGSFAEPQFHPAR